MLFRSQLNHRTSHHEILRLVTRDRLRHNRVRRENIVSDCVLIRRAHPFDPVTMRIVRNLTYDALLGRIPARRAGPSQMPRSR
jgi:hypothetical protein